MPDPDRYDHTRRLDDGQTRRLDDEPGEPGVRTRQRYDAEGDTVYDTPHDYHAVDDMDDDDAGADSRTRSGPPVRQRRGGGVRTFMWFVCGLGLGFVAALLVVAVYGNGSLGGDDGTATLQQELADTQQQLDDLRSTIEQRDQQISDLQQSLDDAASDAERSDVLDQIRDTLQERQQALDQLSDELGQRQEAIQERLDQLPGNLPTPDVDLPGIDGQEAQAWIDRTIESLRELFR